jgi:hypothetical protein
VSRAIRHAGTGLVVLGSVLAGIWLNSRQAPVDPPSPAAGPGRTSRLAESARSNGLVFAPAAAYQRVFEETSSLTFTFRLTNTGPQTINVLRVIPGCGCTSARLDAEQLAPREDTSLHVIYNVAGLFGELPKREVVLVTDDPVQPISRCSVSGCRQQRFQIDPPTADFGVTLRGAPRTVEVSVQAVGPDMELVLEKTIVDSPWLTVEADAPATLPDDTTRFTLRIGLKEETPQGVIHARVFIPRVQDDGVGPVIPVCAEVCGPVRLVPPQAFVGILAPGAVVTRHVAVQVAPAALTPKSSPQVLVDGFGETPQGIHLTKDEQDPSHVSVTVTAAQMPPGQFSHNLVVKCTVDAAPYEALLPISGVVAE